LETKRKRNARQMGDDPAHPPRSLDVHGAAEFLNCSVMYLKDLHNRGLGPPRIIFNTGKHGRRASLIRYRVADLIKWEEDNMHSDKGEAK
jgi:hypothetical protein